MARIRVSTVIKASPAAVWEELSQIERHVDWMSDAVSLTFTGSVTSGPGTKFDVLTKVGPFKITDQMEITSWKVRREISVRHTGVVTGEGTFTLSRVRRNRTRIIWREQHRFPIRLGGPVGAFIAKPILYRIWRKNLNVLKAIVESGRTAQQV